MPHSLLLEAVNGRVIVLHGGPTVQAHCDGCHYSPSLVPRTHSVRHSALQRLATVGRTASRKEPHALLWLGAQWLQGTTLR